MDVWPLGALGPVLVAGLFVAVAAAEMARPGRPPGGATERRWFGNLALWLTSGAILALPAATVLAAALAAEPLRIGLLDRLDLPVALRGVLAVLALDALAYATHRLCHAVGPLWRLHAVHHSDPDLDAATHLRHHPGEALVEAAVQGGAVLVLGLSAAEIAAYAMLAWTVQLLAHANLAPPRWPGPRIGAVLVTPGFHAVHHSPRVEETDSNFGQVLTVWDRLFGTARSGPPTAGPVEFGLDAFRDARSQGPGQLLAQPFRRPADGAPVAAGRPVGAAGSSPG